MPWLQVCCETTREYAATLEDELFGAGAASVTFQDSEDQPIFEPALGEMPLWHATRVVGLFPASTDTAAIDGILTEALGTSFNWRWEILEDKDWEREWMQHYHPIQCGPRFWVCPSWSDAPDPNATNLRLDPGLAFGTGTHPTTFLCLQWLAQQNLQHLSVIDYGCGSGILGIAALLLGAADASGVDIDPQALLASRENARRNNLPADAFPVHLPNTAPLNPADLVVANILAGPLVELGPQITALVKPGGLLCLSGVLAAQAPTVMDAYKTRFDFEPIRTMDEWALLSARKHP